MTIPIILLLCNILVFITAFVSLSYMITSWRQPSVRWLIILVGSFCVVSFCTLGVYIVRDVEIQILFSRMRFLTLGLLPPSWLLFLTSVYQRPKWLQRPIISFLIFLPGLVTSLLTVVPYWRDYVAFNFSPVEINHFVVLKYTMGPWFQYHYTWAMLLVGASLILGVYLFIQEKGIRRHQVIILTFCSVLAAAVDIYCVLSQSPMRWLMLASGTFFISLVGIVFSTAKLKLLNVTSLALNRVFQEFPDPVIVIDGEKKVRMANKASAEFFIIQNLIGKNIDNAIQMGLVEGEVALFDLKGEKHFFNLSLDKLETDSEQISGQVVFFRRITLQKSIEKRLNENLEFKARLLSLIAHDLFGQMEAQALVSSSLQEEVNDESIRERIDLIASSTMVSQEFVENILSWVKSQKNDFEAIKKDFEWNTLIKECIEEQASVCKMKNIEIIFHSNTWPLIAQGDSNMLGSVVRNLLTNAIRATNNAQKINVNLFLIDQKIRVEIIDSGVGMNEEVLSKVRGLSFAFPNENQSTFNSFGIGLMIVKRFLDLHHGEFFIESKLNEGTKVSFEMNH